jgi:hypothetical protein
MRNKNVSLAQTMTSPKQAEEQDGQIYAKQKAGLKSRGKGESVEGRKTKGDRQDDSE